MFLSSTIWKRTLWQSFAGAFFAVVLSLALAPGAQAVGEEYSWGDATKSSIKATKGNFGGRDTVVFQKDSSVPGVPTNSAAYTASATYTCGGKTLTSKLTITVDAANMAATPAGGSLTGQDAACANDPLTDFAKTVSIQTAGVDPITGQPTDPTANAPPECNQGGLSWLFCPVIDNISAAVSNLAKDALVPLLRVNQISQDNTPELYKAWERIRDLTGALFILIFIAVIFGTLTQQDIRMFDDYTLKKIWPRLIIAAVLIQFSFLLSSFLVDVGNVMGGGIEALLKDVLDPSMGPATLGNLIQNLVTGGLAAVAGAGAIAVLASWTAAVPILVSLLISLLVVFLTLGARYLLIAVLIVVSPLACAAIVLPNTRKYFDNWLEFLFRLVLMYPLVVGIIVIAGMLNQILPFDTAATDSTAANVAATLIKPLVVIAAFLVIPATFKLASATLNRAQALLTNTADRGRGMLKGSDMWQRGQDKRQDRKNELMGRVLKSNTITGLNSKGRTGQAAAGFLGGAASMALLRAPANTETLQRSNSARLSALKKQAEGLDEGWNPKNVENALMAYRGENADVRNKARKAAQASAPNLLRMADTPMGQRALLSMLNDREMLTSKMVNAPLSSDAKPSFLRVSNGNLEGNYAADIGALQSKRNYLPGGVARVTSASDVEGGYKVKDAIGSVIRTIPDHQVGDVDINTVAKTYRKLGSKAGDPKTHSLENWAIMQQTANNSLSTKDQNIGRHTFEGFARGTDAQVITKIFDISNPLLSDSNYEVRLQALRSFQANKELYPEFKTHFDIATNSLISDNKVVGQLMSQIEKEYKIDKAMMMPVDGDLNAQAAIVRDWVKGEFSPSDISKYVEEGVNFRWQPIQAKTQAQLENRLRVEAANMKNDIRDAAVKDVNEEIQKKNFGKPKPEQLPEFDPNKIKVKTREDINPNS